MNYGMVIKKQKGFLSLAPKAFERERVKESAREREFMFPCSVDESECVLVQLGVCVSVCVHV